MNRRNFLKALFKAGVITSTGLILPYVPKTFYSFPSEIGIRQNHLFKGYLGQYGGVIVHQRPGVVKIGAVKIWSESIFKEIQRGDKLRALIDSLISDQVLLKGENQWLT